MKNRSGGNFAVPISLMALAACVLLFSSCAKARYSEGLYAEIDTEKGMIVLELEFEKVPMTVANFVGLAEGAIENSAIPAGVPFFDGTVFHRVVPGHVIQAGSPAGSNEEGPGYMFPNEIHPDLDHGRPGMVGMANGGPHTNGSQFYITLGDRSYLDGDYTVFGRVARGMEAVDAIVQGDRVNTVRIIRTGRKAMGFHPETASFGRMVAEAEMRVKDEAEKRRAAEEELITLNWPEVSILEGGLRIQILAEGKGKPPAAGSVLNARYTARTLDGTEFVSTAEDGKPDFRPEAETFGYTVGTTRVNAALDEALAGMKKGERRLLVVPAGLGYGSRGYYAPQRPGEKRFHISPGTTLVYEVEVLDIRDSREP